MANTEISLVKTKGASKALIKLVEVVSGAIGRVYTPVETVLNAYADAKAEKIRAIASGTLPLAVRAAERVAHIEERRQQNIEQIIAITASELPPKVSAEPLDTDWVSAFFEQCKDIGSEHMQQIWAKILAGEVATPGSFSKRTLSIVQAMTKEEAALFTRFGSLLFELRKGEYSFVIPTYEVYTFIRANIATSREEVKLRDIGLLGAATLNIHTDEKDLSIRYFGQPYLLSIPKRSPAQIKEASPSEDFDIKYLPLTDAGNELVPIAGATPAKEFLEIWQKDQCITRRRILKPVKPSTKRKR